jgi:hypothetical protein
MKLGAQIKVKAEEVHPKLIIHSLKKSAVPVKRSINQAPAHPLPQTSVHKTDKHSPLYRNGGRYLAIAIYLNFSCMLTTPVRTVGQNYW